MTTVEEQIGKITIECDYIGCQRDFEHVSDEDGKPDFTSMSRDARVEGWKIFNKNGTWHHLCEKHKNYPESKL